MIPAAACRPSPVPARAVSSSRRSTDDGVEPCGWPSSAYTASMPTLQQSASLPLPPVTVSGAMKPTTPAIVVVAAPSSGRTVSKSMTTGEPSGRTMTLPGWRSRWVRPWRWRASTAPATPRTIGHGGERRHRHRGLQRSAVLPPRGDVEHVVGGVGILRSTGEAGPDERLDRAAQVRMADGSDGVDASGQLGRVDRRRICVQLQRHRPGVGIGFVGGGQALGAHHGAVVLTQSGDVVHHVGATVRGWPAEPSLRTQCAVIHVLPPPGPA